jgi:uncharacterized membrane protein YphA (DoxX/SURF4 family)
MSRGRSRAPSPPRKAAVRAAAATGAPDSARSRLRGVAGSAAADWAPTVSRVLLGLVLAWFGYHELVRPGQWTGYVPVLSPSSPVAVILVLVHGWVLLMLAAALIAGIAPRVAAAIAAVTLTEIVISLLASGGWSDLVVRDVGVLGLAISLTGSARHRLVLR